MAAPARHSGHPPSGIDDIAAGLFADIALLSADTEGVSRPAYSQTETRTLAYLETYARSSGLAVRYDAGQNLVISLPEDADSDRYMLVGSHVDSVPRGGNYDGLAGVVAGILCLVRARHETIEFAHPVKVIALRGEESAWFGPCYTASKALLGQLHDNELTAAHKADGRSLDDHMEAVGVDMERVRSQQPLIDPASILGYLELHIEQGPLLIEKKLPAAAVSGIRGNIRHKRIRCIGEAGHSGAVPRAFRRDPVLAMADLLSRLDESWLTVLQKGEDLVLTCGTVATDPKRHALARIPDLVDFSLDIRSQSALALDEMRGLVAREIATIERTRRVRFDMDEEMLTPPAMCNSDILDRMTGAMERLDLEPFVMPSGGGHDAAVFANAGIPTGMIFVRNQNGSHNPQEAMEIGDFIHGADIIFETLVERTG